jgi:DNA replication protein DnaC
MKKRKEPSPVKSISVEPDPLALEKVRQQKAVNYQREKMERINAQARKEASLLAGTKPIVASPDISGKIIQVFKSMRDRTAKFETFIDCQLQAIYCKTHGTKLKLAVDDMKTRLANTGQFVAMYQECIECEIDQKKNTWLVRSGVPLELIHANLLNWTPRTEDDVKALEWVKQFCEIGNKSLILTGTVGLGKGHLAVGCLKEFRGGLFITQDELLESVRARYDNHNLPDMVQASKRAPLFVLDEFGLSVGGKDEKPMLHRILDYRHKNLKPTIITTNLTRKEFEAELGVRLYDRFSQNIFAFITLRGSSWRAQCRDKYGK